MLELASNVPPTTAEKETPFRRTRVGGMGLSDFNPFNKAVDALGAIETEASESTCRTNSDGSDSDWSDR